MTESVEEEGDVCHQNLTYRIAVPVNMSWAEGIDICQKLSRRK